jgi:DNA-binding IclR family transcriptional regulator
MSSATRALRVLEYLLEQPAPTQSELSRVLDIPNSTLGDLLRELRELGYVHSFDMRYRPGPALLHLAYVGVQRLNVLMNVRPALNELAEAIGETAIYLIEVGGNTTSIGQILLVDQAESPRSMRYVATLGTPYPFGNLGGGRVLLAWSDRELDAVGAPQLRQLGVDDSEQLAEELASVRARGYAVSGGDDPGTAISIVAPVFDANRQPAGAISVTGPAFRMTDVETRIWPLFKGVLDRLELGPPSKRGGKAVPRKARPSPSAEAARNELRV